MSWWASLSTVCLLAYIRDRLLLSLELNSLRYYLNSREVINPEVSLRREQRHRTMGALILLTRSGLYWVAISTIQPEGIGGLLAFSLKRTCSPWVGLQPPSFCSIGPWPFLLTKEPGFVLGCCSSEPPVDMGVSSTANQPKPKWGQWWVFEFISWHRQLHWGTF